ncbi:MAG: hypothetical protein EOM92_20270 [Gammaproteobacteria bacterium]|nr:hypothetical protein [Gammaproteobacteria bacterium]
MTLRTRIMLAMGLTSTIMLFVIVGLASHFLHATNEGHFEERTAIMGRMMAASLKDAMIAKDLARLDAIITEAIAANDKMIRVCAFDQQGARLSTCRCHALSERPYPGERILETPIMVGDDVYGSVGVAFSAAHIERDIATVERNLYLVATILLGVTLIVAWLMGDTLSRQLQAIQHELVAEDPHELPTFPGRCEIDQVARSVNALIVKRRQEKFRADA